MQISPLREIANELPFFKTVDDREKLLGVIGALVLREISLSKAVDLFVYALSVCGIFLSAFAADLLTSLLYFKAQVPFSTLPRGSVHQAHF